MKEEQWQGGGLSKLLRRCINYSRTQGLDLRHRESTIQQLSIN